MFLRVESLDAAYTLYGTLLECMTTYGVGGVSREYYHSAAVQDICRILRERGVHFIGPEKGRLACGDEDIGRMSEVPDIVAEIQKLLPAK